MVIGNSNFLCYYNLIGKNIDGACVGVLGFSRVHHIHVVGVGLKVTTTPLFCIRGTPSHLVIYTCK